MNNLHYGMPDEKRYAYGDADAGYIDDEEMSETEKELADDAQWKIIQKNTFTRWVNEHIKKDGRTITDLQNDFADGLRLISLVEVLSGTKFKGVNRRPQFRTQKLENVTMTLRFLEENEGLRLVNIDSSDIVDCRLKLILGLIWTLILHYSISLPAWEGETVDGDKNKNQTPKQRLLGWLNTKMPEKPVHNFTTDWNDGTAIGALVDACGPGLCPDWLQWQPQRALDNAREAMDTAEKWMEIPQLIKPEEMVNPQIDEKAVMTYLSQFPNAKLKSGAPLRNRSNPARVRAYGPGVGKPLKGLEPEGNVVGFPARFTVDTFSAGKGTVDVIVLNPRGQKEPCEVIVNAEKQHTYACEYRPGEDGEYRVIVKFCDKEIPSSPFKVNVSSPTMGNAQLVNASGPGLEPTGNHVGRRTYFNIFTMGAGAGNVDCVILDPHGRRDTLKPRITKQATDNYLVEYTPKEEGLHSVNVFFSGQPIPTSPYGVMVGPSIQGKLAYASGRGIQPQGMRVNDPGDFKVHTEECGPGNLEVVVNAPNGSEVPCSVKEVKENLHHCRYVPQTPGMYSVNVKYGDESIQRSPFQVSVNPQITSEIRAFGPGLNGGVINKLASFVVETNGETGALGFSIEGPSEARIDCQDNGDGSANVCYCPTALGEYAVHILCDDEDIPQSPFMAEIVSENNKTHPERVKAYGPGLESNVTVNQPTEFTVDVRAAGAEAPTKVNCYDKRGDVLPCQLRNNNDGTYTCKYTPRSTPKCTVIVSHNGLSIPGSPFTVPIQENSNPSKVRVYGPGVESIRKNKLSHFFVDCTEAGPGDVGISITDGKGENVPIDTEEQPSATKESIFRIEYTPETPGPFYLVQVYFADVEVPKSPFRVPMKLNYDLSKIKVEGLESQILVNEPQDFDIVMPGSLHEVQPDVRINELSGKKVSFDIEETVDGFAVAFTPKSLGPHTVEVEVEDQPVDRSPYVVTSVLHKDEQTNMILWPVQAVSEPLENIRAYGEGLFRAKAQEPSHFSIECHPASKTTLGVSIDGPSEAIIDSSDNGNGQCDVTYVVSEPGRYSVNIYADQNHIDGSPFTVNVTENAHNRPAFDVRLIRAFGPGLESYGPFVESFSRFTVDARLIDPSGNGVVKAVLIDPSQKRLLCGVESNNDGTYKCAYSPLNEGQHVVEVTYESYHVPGSPFSVYVSPGCDPSLVKVFGPGLEGYGFTNEPQKFTVDIDGAGQGSLGLAIEGPVDASIQCHDNKNGTCSVEYLPIRSGNYDVIVKFNDIHVTGSPFHVPINDKVDVSKVRCYGPGIESDALRSAKVAQFTVDASRSGEAPLQVTYHPAHNSSAAKAAVIQRKQIRTSNNLFDVFYEPDSVGPYFINVIYAGQPVPGSPFRQDILPVGEVKTVGEGVKPSRGSIPASLHTHFSVDTREADSGDLEMAVLDPKGQSVPLDLEDHGDGTYDCYYLPNDIGMYSVNIRLGGKEIHDSPFHVNAIASGRADYCRIIEGTNDIITVGQDHTIIVDKSSAGKGSFFARIVDPHGRVVKHKTGENRDGTVSFMYLPMEQGKFQVDIKFGGQTIHNGHFVQKALPLELIMEKEKPTVTRGTESTKRKNGIHSSTSSTLMSSYNPIDFKLPIGPVFDLVKAQVRTPHHVTEEPRLMDNGDGTVTVYYQPSESGEHLLFMWYNDHPISGSPFKFHVEGVTGPGVVNAFGAGLTTGVAGELANFTIVTRETGAGGLSLAVEGPSKAEIQCRDNKNGTCSVNYLPLVPGEYSIIVKFLEKHIPGSPFTAKIKERVMFSCRKSPSESALNDTSLFPSTVYLLCKPLATVSLHDGLFAAAYNHQLPHLVVSNTSLTTNQILSDLNRQSHYTIGSTSEVPLKVSESDLNSLSGAVVSPSQHEIACVLKRLDNGNLGISFTPREGGEHIVHIYRHGQPIPNSPFQIFINPNEIGNANRVKCFGEGLHRGKSRENNQFTVDTRDAGYANLGLSIEGPSKVEIECHDQNDGTCLVTWRPGDPGTYIVNVRYADAHVSGSPYAVLVSGDSGPCHLGTMSSSHFTAGQVKPTAHLTASNSLRQSSADASQIGSQCELSLKISGAQLNDLVAQVTSPSAFCYLCEVFEFSKENFTVRFVPREIGVHTVSVRHQGVHIPGSPFQFNVGPIVDGGAQHVHVSGTGISQATARTSNEFCISTRDAGAGGLSIVIEGPSKAEIDFDDHKDGVCIVTYQVPEAGDYLCSIKFNDDHINGSPFHIRVQESANQGLTSNTSFHAPKRSGSSYCSALNHEKQIYQVGKPINFSVSYSSPHLMSNPLNVSICDYLRAHISVASGQKKPAIVQTVKNEPNQYTVKFIPTEPGPHWIHVVSEELNREIAGSPFLVEVELGDNTSGDHHALVTAIGQGLSRGVLGEINKFFVRTINAGNGPLNVTIDGPSKVKIECQEVEDGYNFSYVVNVPGEYLLSIKYGNDGHVAGSPYKVTISESKVNHSHHYSDDVFENEQFLRDSVGRKLRDHEFTSPLLKGNQAPRVHCHGTGLTTASIGQVNQFKVDASKASTDVLYIGLVGPVRPCDEVNVKHLGNSQYSVSYKVEERGRHKLCVKWGDYHVPGSPFFLDVA